MVKTPPIRQAFPVPAHESLHILNCDACWSHEPGFLPHMPEALPLSAGEALAAEQASLDALRQQLADAEAALAEDREVRRQQMEGIWRTGSRTEGVNELLALAQWWDTNYRRGFWSVEAQEGRIAEIRREVSAKHKMLAVKTMLRRNQDACVRQCWGAWAQAAASKEQSEAGLVVD